MPRVKAPAIGLGVRPVTRPLAVDVAAELDAARHRIAFDEIPAEDLGQPALNRAPPEIHLKEAVLRLHEPLREEQIVLILRGNVRHAPAVADDPDGRRQALERDGAGDLREHGGRRRRAYPSEDPHPALAADQRYTQKGG